MLTRHKNIDLALLRVIVSRGVLKHIASKNLIYLVETMNSFYLEW